MQITFYGAAGEVTGSSSLLHTAGYKILIDCGLFQGAEFVESKNHTPLSFNPRELTAVCVTHAHLDHVGRLPVLVKQGFAGPIYATPATAELLALILEDSLEVMEYNFRHFGHPLIYEAADIAAVQALCTPIPYNQPFTLSSSEQPVTITFHDAGHIFGSSFIEIVAEGKRVVFSGDVGNKNMPILRETEALPQKIDALVCESTYGNRQHEVAFDRQAMIEDAVVEALNRKGVLMIPAFSLERTQELLYDLNDLIDRKKKLPRVPIFLDSPLAIRAMSVYRKFPEYYDEAAKRYFDAGDDLFQFQGLIPCQSREESKKINAMPGPKIIIAGAGMMNGGRILHHALRYLSDARSTLLMVGYQAEGTLGRKILQGISPVTVLGESVAVRCQVKLLNGLSAHADTDKLTDWIGATKPKAVFLNHGERATSEALAGRLAQELGLSVQVVAEGLTVTV